MELFLLSYIVAWFIWKHSMKEIPWFISESQADLTSISLHNKEPLSAKLSLIQWLSKHHLKPSLMESWVTPCPACSVILFLFYCLFHLHLIRLNLPLCPCLSELWTCPSKEPELWSRMENLWCVRGVRQLQEHRARVALVLAVRLGHQIQSVARKQKAAASYQRATGGRRWARVDGKYARSKSVFRGEKKQQQKQNNFEYVCWFCQEVMKISRTQFYFNPVWY